MQPSPLWPTTSVIDISPAGYLKPQVEFILILSGHTAHEYLKVTQTQVPGTKTTPNRLILIKNQLILFKF